MLELTGRTTAATGGAPGSGAGVAADGRGRAPRATARRDSVISYILVAGRGQAHNGAATAVARDPSHLACEMLVADDLVTFPPGSHTAELTADAVAATG